MKAFDTSEFVSLLAVLVSVVSMILVSRNTRRATSVNAQNVDLIRIRDLRQELSDTRTELATCQAQVRQLTVQLQEANEAALAAYREREEMRRYAQLPGIDIDAWQRRFTTPPQTLNGATEA